MSRHCRYGWSRKHSQELDIHAFGGKARTDCSLEEWSRHSRIVRNDHPSLWKDSSKGSSDTQCELGTEDRQRTRSHAVCSKCWIDALETGHAI